MKLKSRLRKLHRHCHPGYICFIGTLMAVICSTSEGMIGETKGAFLWLIIATYMALSGILICRIRILSRAGEIFEARAFSQGALRTLEACGKHVERLHRLNQSLLELLEADKHTMDDCNNTLDELLSHDGIILHGVFYKAVKDDPGDACEKCALKEECSLMDEPCFVFNSDVHLEILERKTQEPENKPQEENPMFTPENQD